MDAFRKGDDIYRVSVMVEVIAANEDVAVDYVDLRLITDSVVNDPRFVSFSIASTKGTREVTA